MTLTDRYIAATVAKLPANQRADVEAQLREAIGDAVDDRLDQGEASGTQASASAVETDVLTEFGDPEMLAATYADRRLYLIGPDLYLPWKRLTRVLLWVILPILAVAVPVGSVMAGDPWAEVLGGTIWTVFSVGVHIVFWVTLGFAIASRTRTAPESFTEPWTVDDLPDAPQPQQSSSDTVGSTIMLAVAATAIVWQQVRPPAVNDAGEGLPALNPELWTFILPAALVVLALELGATIVRHVRGAWSMGLFAANTVLNLAFVALVAVPVFSHELLNRALFDHIGWPSEDFPIDLELQEWGVLAVVAAIAVWDIVDTWVKTRRARATPPAPANPAP